MNFLCSLLTITCAVRTFTHTHTHTHTQSLPPFPPLALPLSPPTCHRSSPSPHNHFTHRSSSASILPIPNDITFETQGINLDEPTADSGQVRSPNYRYEEDHRYAERRHDLNSQKSEHRCVQRRVHCSVTRVPFSHSLWLTPVRPSVGALIWGVQILGPRMTSFKLRSEDNIRQGGFHIWRPPPPLFVRKIYTVCPQIPGISWHRPFCSDILYGKPQGNVPNVMAEPSISPHSRLEASELFRPVHPPSVLEHERMRIFRHGEMPLYCSCSASFATTLSDNPAADERFKTTLRTGDGATSHVFTFCSQTWRKHSNVQLVTCQRNNFPSALASYARARLCLAASFKLTKMLVSIASAETHKTLDYGD